MWSEQWRVVCECARARACVAGACIKRTHTEAVAIPVRLVKNRKVRGREDVGKGPSQCAEITCPCTVQWGGTQVRMRDWHVAAQFNIARVAVAHNCTSAA